VRLGVLSRKAVEKDLDAPLLETRSRYTEEVQASLLFQLIQVADAKPSSGPHQRLPWRPLL
jgi:hypothetical protein